MKFLIFVIFIVIGLDASGQTETPAVGLGHVGIVKKEDSSGTLFTDTFDTSLIYFIGKDHQDYRLWKNNVLILTGNLGGRVFRDYLQKFGKWNEYYANGKLKATGNYDHNNPIGIWTYYYANGNKKNWFTLAKVETDSATSYCKTGIFEEFYSNGKIKLRGYYKISFDTSFVTVIKPDTTNYEKMIHHYSRGHRSKPDLTWIYYKITGEIERKVQF